MLRGRRSGGGGFRYSNLLNAVDEGLYLIGFIIQHRLGSVLGPIDVFGDRSRLGNLLEVDFTPIEFLKADVSQYAQECRDHEKSKLSFSDQLSVRIGTKRIWHYGGGVMSGDCIGRLSKLAPVTDGPSKLHRRD